MFSPCCRPLFIITVIVDILLECVRLESAISQRVNEWNEPRVAFGALMLLAENWQSFPESMRLSARELFFLALKKINSAALSREAKLVSREPREPVGITTRSVFLHSPFLLMLLCMFRVMGGKCTDTSISSGSGCS